MTNTDRIIIKEITILSMNDEFLEMLLKDHNSGEILYGL